MKTTFLAVILSVSTMCAFICSYFLELTMDNLEQFLSVCCVVLLDGFFGMIAGIKREGFKTFKALSVLRTVIVWWFILAVILTVEKSFTGTGWLSETIIVPFLIFQIISALKNASMAGLIKVEALNNILDKIDKHKGLRK
jgi:phage-related holin